MARIKSPREFSSRDIPVVNNTTGAPNGAPVVLLVEVARIELASASPTSMVLHA